MLVMDAFVRIYEHISAALAVNVSRREGGGILCWLGNVGTTPSMFPETMSTTNFAFLFLCILMTLLAERVKSSLT